MYFEIVSFRIPQIPITIDHNTDELSVITESTLGWERGERRMFYAFRVFADKL